MIMKWFNLSRKSSSTIPLVYSDGCEKSCAISMLNTCMYICYWKTLSLDNVKSFLILVISTNQVNDVELARFSPENNLCILIECCVLFIKKSTKSNNIQQQQTFHSEFPQSVFKFIPIFDPILQKFEWW